MARVGGWLPAWPGAVVAAMGSPSTLGWPRSRDHLCARAAALRALEVIRPICVCDSMMIPLSLLTRAVASSRSERDVGLHVSGVSRRDRE